jgi:hypothetical protein
MGFAVGGDGPRWTFLRPTHKSVVIFTRIRVVTTDVVDHVVIYLSRTPQSRLPRYIDNISIGKRRREIVRCQGWQNAFSSSL